MVRAERVKAIIGGKRVWYTVLRYFQRGAKTASRAYSQA